MAGRPAGRVRFAAHFKVDTLRVSKYYRIYIYMNNARNFFFQKNAPSKIKNKKIRSGGVCRAEKKKLTKTKKRIERTLDASGAAAGVAAEARQPGRLALLPSGAGAGTVSMAPVARWVLTSGP